MEKLLNLLKSNARLTNRELAVMLGKTEQDVLKQIAEYESKGIIRGYGAIINEELLDKEKVTAFIELKVTPQAQYGYDDIAHKISQYSQVDEVSLMSGGFDLSVTLSGSNLKEIALFVSQRLATIDGVLSTSTHFVLKRYKQNGIFLEDSEIDERGYVSP